MNYNNDKLNEIYRDTWPNLGWAAKNNKFMTHEEMLEEAAKREAANKQVYPDGDSIESLPHVTRVEVIGKKGREFTQYDCSNVQVSIQDQGRTLKVFLS
jgi:hypothetical protein